MKKLTQGVFLRTTLILALTIVLSITFASGVFAAVTDADSLLSTEATDTALGANLVSEGDFTSANNAASTGVVPLPLTGTIPVDYAPTISHSVAGIGADESLWFPYRIVLTGTANIVNFNLYIVDSETREVITTLDHLGEIFDGSGGISATPSLHGDFIQIVPGGNPGGNTQAHLTILLQHGQEVVITTFIEEHTLGDGGTHWHPPAAAGLGTIGVLSYFWIDGEPAGFVPTGFNPGPPDGFDLEHRDYIFSLANPALPPWNQAPQHFHPAFGSASEYAEGFAFHSFGHLPTALRDNPPVRVDAVWTLGDPIEPSEVTTATAPLTKVLSVETTNSVTVPDITFEFEFTKLSFDYSSDEATMAANMPVVPNQTIPIDSDDYTANAVVTEDILDGVDIVFDRPGTFVYEVREVSGATTSLLPPGMTPEYSPAVYTLIIVVTEEAGVLSHTMTIEVFTPDSLNPNAPAAESTVETLVFTNVLTYVPVEPSEVTTTVPLTKILSVEATTPVNVPETTFEFAFGRTGGSETTTTTASLSIPAISNTTTTTASGSIDVDFSFDTTGTFVYRVVELQPTNALPTGMTMAYSDAVYLLTFEVEKDEGVLVITNVTVIVESPDASDAIDELVFTNVLTYVAGEEPPPPPTCPECGQTPPCDISDTCGRPLCVCDCETGGQETPCPECDEYPCICTQPPPPCDVCGEYPCVCETGGQGTGNEGGGTQTTPTPPRGDGRDPAPVGPKTGDWSNPSSHLLHMLVAAVIMVVVLYRLTCSSEALAKRKG